ncbi:receptor protein kinase-like protein At4g34220 [Phalaenopsis equestris]|uniref:receptor protein kinase-like protein At4g34220 n=1 Tax=Phalaenopsis equestris TaxID=78828 RepID=UPI0009E2CD76|nr:receptor protein kinase-like protein At4g34220 [Phalaenopsis equestris]
MRISEIEVHLQWRLQALPFMLLLLCKPSSLLALSKDGVLLLSFKHSVLGDPLSVLADWNSEDETPCSWNGVMCTGFPAAGGENSSEGGNWQDGRPSSTVSRVISLVLPGSQLLGSITDDLGQVEHLRHLDLSGNVLNGTLPSAFFNASELRILSLADNEISGELPELFGKLQSLQVLNLSDNAFMGEIARNLTLLPNLTIVTLSNNYLSGELPSGGFKNVEVLDLGSNLLNGSLPADLTGENIRYLNLSYNRFAGEIPAKLGSKLSSNVTLDLSFNNLSGEIPPSEALLTQKAAAFVGNHDLCGKPLKNICTIPSTLSNPPNNSSPASKSPPAFAVMPKTPQGYFPVTDSGDGESSHSSAGLKPTTIAAIAIGDLAGLGLLLLLILFFHHSKKKQDQTKQIKSAQRTPEPVSKNHGGLSSCFQTNSSDGNETEETSESNISSETEAEEEKTVKAAGKEDGGGKPTAGEKNQGGILVSVDGETELEVETLLKASAYILGATGASIVYKAVLADGTAFAVRRIGESSSIDKLKDFEAQVRIIAKLRHPNILPLRCFYWGADEKLLIHHYASNGSLANIFFSKKLGSSPFHLSWESRLRIARGVARGLAYLHDKKFLHGNLKPSNILLSSDLEPMIGDLGVDRLLTADNDTKPGTSARHFGSKRSTLSQGSLPDLSSSTNAGASPISSTSAPPPYQAPESLKNLKPNAKWDVYSFGMVLLELISGRVFLEVEIMQWNAAAEEKKKVLRMVDPALRGEVEGKEEVLLSCFKVGFGCAAMAAQRRPSMREVVQVLERLVVAAGSSS